MSLVRSAALRSGLARISAMRSVESVGARLSRVVALCPSGVVALRLSGAVAQAPSTDAIAPTTASEKDAFRMSRVAMTRTMAPLYRSRVYPRPASDLPPTAGDRAATDPAGRRECAAFATALQPERPVIRFSLGPGAARHTRAPCLPAASPLAARAAPDERGS